MKVFIIILLIFFSISGISFAQNANPPDSSVINSNQAPAIIQSVIKSKTPPDQDKITVISQLTKYGFMNLFSQFRYNPALPYASQVNPNAGRVFCSKCCNKKKREQQFLEATVLSS